MKKGLRERSASERGTKKQVSPVSVRARVKKASLIGAEQNHLCPASSNSPSPRGTARDELARRSEPPCLSVIAMPIVTARFCARGSGRGSESHARSFGSHSSASFPLWRRTPTAAQDILTG